MKYYDNLCTRVLAVLLGLAITSCVNEDWLEQADSQEEVPVRIACQVVPEVDTRSSVSDVQLYKFPSNSDFLVRASRHGENSYSNYEYYSNRSPKGDYLMFPLDGTAIDIKAFHPAAVSGGTHTVLSDQTSVENYNASDLMVAQELIGQSKTSNNVYLYFYHRLSKLILYATPDAGVKRIKTVKLKNVKPTVTFDIDELNVNSTFTAGGEATDITVVKTVDNDIPDGYHPRGTAIIPPQALDDVLVEVEVVMTNDATATATYAFAGHKVLDAGCVYTLNITVSHFDVNKTTSIDWLGNNQSTNTMPPLSFSVGGVLFNMMYVKSGANFANFASTGQDAASNVTLRLTDDYYIGQTEVTQALWTAVMGSNPSQFAGHANNPVEQVSWNMICGEDGFLERLKTATGIPFALPTEAQWEYAARGGVRSKGYTYAGSNTIGDVAWHAGNADDATHPVATRQPNELGLYDMSGNVKEWCSDWHDALTGDATLENPKGAATGSQHAVRGGFWGGTSDAASATCRDKALPTTEDASLGLRLMLEADPGVPLAEAQIGMMVTTDAKCYWPFPVYLSMIHKIAAGVVVYKEGSHGLVLSLTNMNRYMRWDDFAYGNDNPKPLSHTPAVAGYDWVCGTLAQYKSMVIGEYGCGSVANFVDIMRAAGSNITSSWYFPTCTEYNSTALRGFHLSYINSIYYSEKTGSSKKLVPLFAF